MLLISSAAFCVGSWFAGEYTYSFISSKDCLIKDLEIWSFSRLSEGVDAGMDDPERSEIRALCFSIPLFSGDGYLLRTHLTGFDQNTTGIDRSAVISPWKIAPFAFGEG